MHNSRVNAVSLSGHSIALRGNEPMPLEQRVNEYQTLLHRIAYHFEYSDIEATDLITQINAQAVAHYSRQEGGISLKLWLSKMMVHKCIHSISSRMFSQQSLPKNYISDGYNTSSKSNYQSGLKSMPLSFRAVYILHDILKFNEVEIARILNTDIINVKARRSKAYAFIKMPSENWQCE
jgi:DNA-directed RNA polymerase specialized sigma24 family protein